ncbi:MAG: F0F1 ATP synthase subunit A [Candidatus Pacebacteria bacterium]|jgi:F-type H+-transporting ATPase subunit a|nr:F0F1 ATP synthase subunit A [Candidatus Paceibacterota bacterium]MBT4651861.1 F0F1 ATP synthase subunit A [Candidatus Paceibacterota bacterium]MBT6755681.1 F0F1 ATP synthase subunit A [Candidatus Paceibacterota bacterium]MBT6921187.1 F0F1 ATP synthase subunit A [Candidatus Paceibacterota bacterium]
MAANLHISISAETLTSFGPLNFSNSLLTSSIVTILMLILIVKIRLSLDSNKSKISGWQNFSEFITEGFYGMVQGVTGDHKKTRFFLPFFMSFFLFILLNNWLGLLPGVGTIGFRETAEGTEHAVLLNKELSVPVSKVMASTEETIHLEETATENNEEVHAVEAAEEHTEEATDHSVFVPYLRAGTADINTALALGLFSQVMAQIIGIKYLGLSYFKKFFNFKNPIMGFVGTLELISEFSKVLSYTFRLFGNIFAGEVLLVVMSALVPLIVPMPFYGLEIFVGVIQALVFSLLSIVFFNIATISHDEHE